MRYSARAWRSKLADPAGRRHHLTIISALAAGYLCRHWVDHRGHSCLVTTQSHATVVRRRPAQGSSIGNTHVGCDAGSKYDLYFLMTPLILNLDYYVYTCSGQLGSYPNVKHKTHFSHVSLLNIGMFRASRWGELCSHHSTCVIRLPVSAVPCQKKNDKLYRLHGSYRVFP